MPLSVSFTTCSSMSGSCCCGGLDRSPFGSVFADTWNGSAQTACSMCRLMLALNCGSTWLSTSWPSNSDHISPTVSSPTRVTTARASRCTRSTAARLSSQSCWVRGRRFATGLRSPVSSSR